VGAPIKDVDLPKLSGTLLTPTGQSAVTYRLEEMIGQGAHGVVFLALQRLPQAFAPAVVKLLRPRAVRELAGLAGTAIGKEVAALKRLSERVPPTPFVVQFLDAGTLRLDDNVLELPWVAVEYIHGGLEGTTLRARVDATVARSGFAFDLARAHSAVRCITSGVTAIHEVGVLHRDVTPGNVLCCGFGETEVFKIADFGLARVSSASTFGAVLLGTPSYCAPEQSFPDKVEVGPYSDVFGLACTIFFLLTGEPYFTAQSIPETLVAVQSPERRSLADARRACGELRERRALCLEIDRVLARATRADPRERQQSAAELAAQLLPLLSPVAGPSMSALSTAHREERVPTPVSAPPEVSELRWTVGQAPGALAPLHSVGWDSNGNFLAATSDGLVFWDGVSFRGVPFDWPWAPRVVQRTGPGRWLLAGDRGVLADFSEGKVERWVSAGGNVQIMAAAGSFDDIIVAAARRPQHGLELWAWINGRFMEPLALPGFVSVSACVPIDDAAWLFVGESSDQAGTLAEFRPLGHRSHQLESLPGRAPLAVASQLARTSVLIGGSGGYAAALREGSLVDLPLPTTANVSAVAIDLLDRSWAATPGTLWAHDTTWKPAWSDPTWTAPFVSILADVGRLIAVTSEGAIVQGEAPLTRDLRRV
jgi:eukaryotic-like serine/threonine-protein kinase